jgi:ABC-type amino acid transport substrate-binding protein
VRIRLLALLSAVVLGAGFAAAVYGADDAGQASLRVCLNEDVPPFSVRNAAGGSGFDVSIAQAIAKRLERRLEIQWFESKLDEDSSSTIEANALLSDERCALLAGYPLTKDALGKPGAETGKLPDFAGARPADRRRRVVLGELTPTTPYHFAALTVVLGANAAGHHVASLADLDGLNLGVESGTLSDMLLMTFDKGRLIPRVTHLIPGRNELFAKLESGAVDATVVPVHRFDAYRIEHPDTKISTTGFYLPIGFNMGFIGLATNAALIARANVALDEMLRTGEPAALAATAQMTYLPPRQPFVRDSILLSDLTK